MINLTDLRTSTSNMSTEELVTNSPSPEASQLGIADLPPDIR